jgi:molybdate transport system substrate-binding protein
MLKLKLNFKIIRVMMAVCFLVSAGILFPAGKQDNSPKIMVAAAASLKNVLDKSIIPQFEARYHIRVETVYDSSGKLQTQIEQGLPADVFMSAAMTQMDALVRGGFVQKNTVVPLLKNRLALIKKKGMQSRVTGFSAILEAESIALGDTGSVPAGQYAREAFIKLGNWSAIQAANKVSAGTNVTEVLSWVAAGSAEVGVVYSTDAASNRNVEVIALLDDTLLAKPILYPAAPLAKSADQQSAEKFITYLKSSEAQAAFKVYGFSSAF